MTPQQAFKDHPLQLLAKNVVILGAVVLFFIGVQQKNYIAAIFGEHAHNVYILIGIAGVFLAYKEAMWVVYPQSTKVTTTPA